MITGNMIFERNGKVYYLKSDHCAKVQAAGATMPRAKTKKALFTSRTQAKNSIILRHVFERLREVCGPYDGLRGAHCYKKSSEPRKLFWGGPATPFDIHVMDWQLELVEEGLITKQEVLSPGSIVMHMKWAIANSCFKELWKVNRMTFARRPALQAGWLLVQDQLALEKLNFPHGYTFDAVTQEPTDELDSEV